MSWFILILAGLFEVSWAILLKSTDGFTHLWTSIATLVLLLISIILLAFAMKSLPVGTAYTVWTGIGAVGTVILGILFFGDSASISKLFCLSLILFGVIGLKILSS